MKRFIIIVVYLFFSFGTAACGKVQDMETTHNSTDIEVTPSSIEEIKDGGNPDIIKEENSEKTLENDEEVSNMIMMIGDVQVQVAWEDNESVEALRELASQEPVTIQMSMYGGFEQVGSIGQALPRDDIEITTEAGDIVLYSGNQIVVFYGSNSWAYTKLGHISDRSEQELSDLLGNGDVTITIKAE